MGHISLSNRVEEHAARIQVIVRVYKLQLDLVLLDDLLLLQRVVDHVPLHALVDGAVARLDR